MVRKKYIYTLLPSADPTHFSISSSCDSTLDSWTENNPRTLLPTHTQLMCVHCLYFGATSVTKKGHLKIIVYKINTSKKNLCKTFQRKYWIFGMTFIDQIFFQCVECAAVCGSFSSTHVKIIGPSIINPIFYKFSGNLVLQALALRGIEQNLFASCDEKISLSL